MRFAHIAKMGEIRIGNHVLRVKDYNCVPVGDHFAEVMGNEYIPKNKLLLWLYVNVTDRCNAGCKFCVSHAKGTNNAVVDPQRFRKTLEEIAPHIYGISFTGGEPMIYPELLDELIAIADEIVPKDLEIDLATNGTNLEKLLTLKHFSRIDSIHISRHASDDKENDVIMGFKSPSAEDIKAFVEKLDYPIKAVLNCVLQKDGVKSMEDVAVYLDIAAKAGIRNTSFISMFQANEYCRENYVTAGSFPVVSDAWCEEWNKRNPDKKIAVWNRHSDHEYCHCLSGSYHNSKRSTRFYFRCPGNAKSPDYCRQLVYTADNHLQDGFGENRKILL